MNTHPHTHTSNIRDISYVKPRNERRDTGPIPCKPDYGKKKKEKIGVKLIKHKVCEKKYHATGEPKSKQSEERGKVSCRGERKGSFYSLLL